MYKLTERAAEDFAGIYDYTLLKFGEAQADHYTDALEAFFETLSGMPDMGRDYNAVPGVMRIEFQRHIIFYTVRDTDILIARILHQQMNHKRHLR
ncbi:type II toxin-antitoxin system RelE/ParE family toxin [Erwinia tracheiphila]|uniref:Toxin n=1 Tax=Erwinia tracheiphila TaxID=65700 RepID=A0A345CT06_9GAMM|nr:type II toxin-antitoxin system RelE/ParE family toxin [Erwinia tracheiphila]AXF76573.1 type II toxin-antitoxin system RelE/ParE family toxin [Erwinia tracheiphila]UIA84759.1 type II toxin-antitoxin system RelE/ParE family toxin [Erwinia tracheiphila]UIA93353.1 type II toxin-antitoxin system RelE/ParE family toxin [Erwinia tracheiphila]